MKILPARVLRVILLAVVMLAGGCAKKPSLPGAGEKVVFHRVQEGETLQQISEDYFGNPDRAKDIMKVNGLASDELEQGAVLRIVLKRKDVEFLKVRKAAREPYNQGLDLSAKGDYLKSIVKFREALEIDPGFVEAKYNLGVAYQKMKAYGKALSFFEEVIRLRPGDAHYRFAWGNCLFHLGRYGDAAGAFQEVIEIKPDHLKAHFSLAAVYEKMGEVEKAKAAWEEYLRLDNDSEWALEARKRLEKLKR